MFACASCGSSKFFEPSVYLTATLPARCRSLISPSNHALCGGPYHSWILVFFCISVFLRSTAARLGRLAWLSSPPLTVAAHTQILEGAADFGETFARCARQQILHQILENPGKGQLYSKHKGTVQHSLYIQPQNVMALGTWASTSASARSPSAPRARVETSELVFDVARVGNKSFPCML